MRELWPALCLILAGCITLNPQGSRPVGTYDFGLPVAAKHNPVNINASLLVPAVSAPSWLDTPAMLYRLAYAEAPRYQAYAESRWVAPPPDLLTLRLRSRVASANEAPVVADSAGVPAQYLLRVGLEEFSQVFDTPQSSRALVRLRASLVDHIKQRHLAQRAFDVTRPAGPNAEGGAQALAGAVDHALEQLLEWVASEIKKAG
jgi:cholesterol transport system auxiliary component